VRSDRSILSNLLRQSIAIKEIVFDLELLAQFDGDGACGGQLLRAVIPAQQHACMDGQIERVDGRLECDDAMVVVQREVAQQGGVTTHLRLGQQIQHLTHLRLVAHRLEQLNHGQMVLRATEILVDQEPYTDTKKARSMHNKTNQNPSTTDSRKPPSLRDRTTLDACIVVISDT